MDLIGIPFVFKIDETTTLQVKNNMMDIQLQYWSKEMTLVNSVYCGSLFVGHCFSKYLLPHFTTFVEDMNLEPDLLMQIGMDGPNVNSKFEKDVYTQINDRYDVSFLMLRSCGIHITMFLEKV